ncbi:MAG: hypothetical protein E5W43_00885 [Mesorhizobium sp.]|nr:MAG: hypothetical protein E5W43_00885 [Mesorhizobium sp.]
MTPQELIADLDAALIDAGQTVTLRRLTLGPGGIQIPFDVENVPAAVRPLKPEELIGNLDQTASRIVISPTVIAARQFPFPVKKGDKIVANGKVRNIEFPGPIYVQDVLVRLNLTVAG